MPDNIDPRALTELSPEEEETTTKQEQETSEEDDNYIRIDKRNYAGELSRLEQEDPHFKEVFRARVGQRAKRLYQPQLDDWEKRYNDLETNIRRQAIQNIPQEQLGQELARNPQLAAEYANITRQPSQEEVLGYQLNQEIHRILYEAVENGLPDDKAEELYKDVTDGKYDENNAGFADFLLKFRKDVFGATLASRTTTQPQTQQVQTQEQPQQQTPSNPNLTTGVPVVGTTSRGKTNGRYIATKAQIDEWTSGNPAKFIEMFPGPTDFDDAVKAGRIQGMGPDSQ